MAVAGTGRRDQQPHRIRFKRDGMEELRPPRFSGARLALGVEAAPALAERDIHAGEIHGDD